MSHAHILTMKRPYETLGMPMPIGRRLGDLGKVSWLALSIVLTVACGAVYVFQISQSASKGYEMRALEKQRDRLSESVSALEAQVADMQSMKALQERLKGLGYVPVQQLEFSDIGRPSVALAK